MKQAHDSGVFHAKGESEFIGDRPLLHNECFVGLLVSPLARGKILHLDLRAASEIPGILRIFTAKDIAHNLWGSIFQDQPLLAEKNVEYVGEVVAVIAGSSMDAVEKAKRAIVLELAPLPAILSVRQAKAARSFIAGERVIRRGDFDAAFAASPHRLEACLSIEGQDHFYLESHAAIAYPGEGTRLEIWSSSQHPTEVQHVVCHALGLPASDVVCNVKRMGGGFGGKESQAAPMAFFAALCAHYLRRPARLILTKDDDMLITGKRNPFEIEYRVGFDSDGKILGLEAKLYSDGGAYADLSTSIMERAMLHCDNAYYLPNVVITGQVCRTNVHPHTAFRGFGGPKGVAMIEDLLQDISYVLGKDSLEVRRANLYGVENCNVTPYGQRFTNNMLPQLFDTLVKTSDYQARREAVQRHNQTSSITCRGLALSPVKFGIAFTTRFLNQANALVNVHRDGTVQVSTGATEMGQGVNTKISKVVADVFGILPSQVRVMTTSTEKNHNTSPTAASSGSDLNGKAAQLAAIRIRDRLASVFLQTLEKDQSRWATKTAGIGTEKELAQTQPEKSKAENVIFADGELSVKGNSSKKLPFRTIVEEAYLNRVQLGDYGFFRYPDLHFDKLKGQGDPFYYFTQGAAVSEVELDRFTGEAKVLRTDILMDLGRSLNPGVDLGQVAGGFIQGMGWVTTEHLVYSEQGALLTHSPSTYKIPTIQDTPRIFNVNWIENNGNQKNLEGSKAVGEPPLLLGLSVWLAIKDALYSAQTGDRKPLSLALPATRERILDLLQGTFRRSAASDLPKKRVSARRSRRQKSSRGSVARRGQRHP